METKTIKIDDNRALQSIVYITTQSTEPVNLHLVHGHTTYVLQVKFTAISPQFAQLN